MGLAKVVLVSSLFLVAGCHGPDSSVAAQADVRLPRSPAPPVEQIVLEKHALRRFDTLKRIDRGLYICITFQDSRGKSFTPSPGFCRQIDEMGYHRVDVMTYASLGSHEGMRIGRSEDTSIHYHFRVVEARSKSLFVIEAGHDGGRMWRSCSREEVEYRDGEIKTTKWLGGYVTRHFGESRERGAGWRHSGVPSASMRALSDASDGDECDA